jgi:hypothetical protein
LRAHTGAEYAIPIDDESYTVMQAADVKTSSFGIAHKNWDSA